MSSALSQATVNPIVEQTSVGTDSLMSGLSFMMVANVVQRGIGFIRNLMLCRFLADEQLGLWALASSFFILAAPLAVLGFPGTLGRLVEPYRKSGHLNAFLNRILSFSIVGVIVCISWLVLAPSTSSSLIFGMELPQSTMAEIGIALFLVIAFNATTELLSGLRKPRLVSKMHTCNSLVFTATSIVGLSLVPDWRVLVASFSIAAAAGLLPAIPVVRELRLQNVGVKGEFPIEEVWRRVLPFALSVWCMNLLSNLFDVVDRYMLLYWATESTETGRALVGQFHSGRIMPVLLSSLTLMLGGLLLPYLASDWEAGRRKEVHDSLHFTFKSATLFFFSLSVASLFVAPTLFETILKGKYADGLSIMPLALMHCCFAGVAVLMQNYFWCVERGKTIGLITAIGLLVNVLLNFAWVPIWGLTGAMLATSVSGGSILLMTTWMMKRSGVPFGYSSLLFGLLPSTLLFGAVPAACCMALVLLMIGRSNLLFSEKEKNLVDQAFLPKLRRFGYVGPSIWSFNWYSK